jgi:hypothetical protein
MLSHLKKVIAINGLITVTTSLGYKSTTTIHKWIRNKKIPKIAHARVKAFLETQEK